VEEETSGADRGRGVEDGAATGGQRPQQRVQTRVMAKNKVELAGTNANVGGRFGNPVSATKVSACKAKGVESAPEAP
jgi:hypothetical protein